MLIRLLKAVFSGKRLRRGGGEEKQVSEKKCTPLERLRNGNIDVALCTSQRRQLNVPTWSVLPHDIEPSMSAKAQSTHYLK